MNIYGYIKKKTRERYMECIQDGLVLFERLKTLNLDKYGQLYFLTKNILLKELKALFLNIELIIPFTKLS